LKHPIYDICIQKMHIQMIMFLRKEET